MKIALVANNIEGNYDGIGKHARLLSDSLKKQNVDVSIFWGKTWNKSKYALLISMEMSKAYLRLCKQIQKEKFDFILVEYPFHEHNPFVLLTHILLYVITRFRRTKIALSLHEFDRVSPFRKVIIIGLILFSDVCFFTESKYINKFKLLNKHSFIRQIPSHINRPNGEKNYDRKRYCFLGLLNKSKAFQEMLDAWVLFNKHKECRLDIITSSQNCDISKYKCYGVCLHQNISDKDVAEIMFNSAFSVIPIMPYVDIINGSFMAATKCGCIPIGVFSKKSNFSFGIHAKSYDLQDFLDAFVSSEKMTDDEISEKSNNASRFGLRYSFDSVAESMIGVLNEKSCFNDRIVKNGDA